MLYGILYVAIKSLLKMQLSCTVQVTCGTSYMVLYESEVLPLH